MEKLSEFTAEDYAVIEREYADLKEAARRRCADRGQMEMIQKAFDFANSAHKGVRRRSGEPYILHPIAVAKIVVTEISLGYKSICAALLHDVVEDTDYTVEDIKNLFGDKISSLVDGLTKIKTVLDNEECNEEFTTSLQAENFKRILLTLNDDVRVVLIKLADRLHNCRTIEFMPEHKREKILSETMYIFIPLAHRLGLYSIKSEMENIWLRFKEPDAYNSIMEMVNSRTRSGDRMIEDFLVPVRESLDKSGLNYVIKKRVKTPYSIWHKIKTKHVTFDQIRDFYAVRIIFRTDSEDLLTERNECFRIFALITAIYEYRPERVRDWLMHPKSNGYEALHLTAISKDGTDVEVQIRSKRMDDIAEKGIAAHWNYKRTMTTAGQEENRMDQWILKVKEILENPDVNSLDLLDIIHNDLVDDEITIFDHKNRQCNITKGYNALDYAYACGVEIGNHAIAAKINYRLAPLSYVLKSGDRVEIITSQSDKPKYDWLSFLNNKTGIEAVKACLGITAEELHTETGNTIYKMATCCNPIPGDPVVGFRQDDGSIILHKKSCPVADSLASKYGDRIITPKWIVDKYSTFPVRIVLNGADRMGLMHEITGKVSKENKISFKSISMTTHDGLFEGFMDIWVHDTDTLESVIKLLSGIRGVHNVSREDQQ